MVAGETLAVGGQRLSVKVEAILMWNYSTAKCLVNGVNGVIFAILILRKMYEDSAKETQLSWVIPFIPFTVIV
jgi:hypothetical protein